MVENLSIVKVGQINQDPSSSSVEAKWASPPQDSFKVNSNASIGSGDVGLRCDYNGESLMVFEKI